jgi:branched-subunit amino acid aminotransferase/4-amino-4-deoxychorismate lyase
MSVLCNFNGNIVKESECLLSINNRSFRYGDGFFETIKVINGKISLENYHIERIKTTIDLLTIDTPKLFSTTILFNKIKELVQKNNHLAMARVRVSFYRGDGGLYDGNKLTLHYIIQSWALQSSINLLNENGLILDFYRTAQKSCDIFSTLKTNNFLPYSMAAIWAKKNKLNDAILLNCQNNVADTTIANIFIIKNKQIITPPTNQGCIAGVTRQFLINNFTVVEQPVSINDILMANEVFITNAIRGIGWVKQINNTHYNNSKTIEIANKFNRKLIDYNK